MKKILILMNILPVLVFSLDPLEIYLEDLVDPKQNTTNWAFQINDNYFPEKSLDFGLQALESNLSMAKMPDIEKKQIKNNYINNYIDQTIVLMKTYTNLLSHPDIEFLFQEFLRQAATQLWLENLLQQNPKAVEPVQEEIDVYYEQNAERLLRLGLSASQIKEFTLQELKQQKVQQWTQDQLKALKSEVKININPKLKKKYKI